jgi:type II secretory pathway pseudopilin PulG
MHKSLRTEDGFGSIELLVALAITAVGISLTTGLMLAGKSHVTEQEKEIEATHAGRAALDTILRELRLGGACLPETGDFIALEATDGGDTDELVTRYGLTTADLSCIQTATRATTTAASAALAVDDTNDFTVGDLAYLRHTSGGGEYFKVTSIDEENRLLGIDRSPSQAYPATSGVYAIDERRFFLDTATAAVPRLMLQVGGAAAQPFAVGIERLDLKYELADGTRLDEPSSSQQWRSVRQVHVSLTSRSAAAGPDGHHYRRSYDVTIKPRNLVDS